MKHVLFASICLLVLITLGCKSKSNADKDVYILSNENEWEANFKNPPHEVRPQAWWWWLQTPTNEQAITLDLEEMKAKGLSGCMVLDGGVGPFGPHKWTKKSIIDSTEIRYEPTDEYKGGYLGQLDEKMEMWSKPWRDMVRFASKETGRLGLDFGVFIVPAGCAAPWVTPNYGQQEIVWGDTIISGGKTVRLNLAKPTTPVQTQRQPERKVEKDAQNAFYTDIAVLAISDNKNTELGSIIDLTASFIDGQLTWNAPNSQWKIMRFGYRPTGRNLNGIFYIDLYNSLSKILVKQALSRLPEMRRMVMSF